MIDHRSEKVKRSINISRVLNDAFTFAIEYGMPSIKDITPGEKELSEGWLKFKIYMERQRVVNAQERMAILVRELEKLSGNSKDLDETMEKIKMEVK